MKTKVLMIYPEFPTTYWSFKYTLKFIGKKSSMPPLGLLTVASLLPDDYEVKLVDMNIEELKGSDVEDADLVFISAMIIQKESFNTAIQLCMKYNAVVVAGGPYPSSTYEKIVGVDHFVLNEAEITLPKFIADYQNGCAKKIYMDDEKPDITLIPPPRFDIVNIDAYSNLALQFSRGCPFNCEFCDIIEMFGRKPRNKLPEQFDKELDTVYETGYRGSIFIVDDNFIGNKKRVKNLLRSIIRWQQAHDNPFSFFTEASINLAQDDELMDLMVEAGFGMVFVGIETPDALTLESAQKGQNLKMDVIQSVEILQKKGLEVTGGFIVGFDTDPDDIFDRQIEFIQRAGIPMAMIGIMIALPNTQLYRRLKKENRLLGDTSGNNTHDLDLNFIPVMPEWKIVAGYKKIISEIYSPDTYFNRCLTLIKRFPHNVRDEGPITLNDIRAFLLSILILGFSRYRKSFFRFLQRVIKFDYRHFKLAITLSVKGYHFFKITEEIISADRFSEQINSSLESLELEVAGIIDRGKWDSRVAFELERCGQRLNQKMKKKYREMNQSVQQHVRESFEKFNAGIDAIIMHSKEHLIRLAGSQKADFKMNIKT